MTRFDAPRRSARRTPFALTVIGIGALALLDNLHVFDIALLRTFFNSMAATPDETMRTGLALRKPNWSPASQRATVLTRGFA